LYENYTFSDISELVQHFIIGCQTKGILYVEIYFKTVVSGKLKKQLGKPHILYIFR